jgi:excinuclease ABC subunit A
LIIEHNLDIIKVADTVIDLGPDGGDRGGELIAFGTPREICEVQASYTGQFLKEYLKLHGQNLT